jgi:hypothetical protein
MEQRRLRLGDTLDDYCPRERRVTNHAVVAMIDDDVKQTRCTTCDAEHAYKGGREPRRRRKETTSVLYREVLAGMGESENGQNGAHEKDAHERPRLSEADPETADDPVAFTPSAPPDSSPQPDEPPTAAEEADDRSEVVEEGPIHRRLIRATLPRPEGQKEARPVPEFTVRNGHGNTFRGDRMRGQGREGNNVRAGGRRFGGGNQGSQGRGGRPGRQGFGGNGGRQGGGRKRSR